MVSRFHKCALLAISAFCLAAPLAAQDVLTDPPNLSKGGGATAGGLYSLGHIESVNAIDGNMNLRISAACFY